MAIFSSTQPSLRARILPRFPAQVLAGNGITITKSGGTYTFEVTNQLGGSDTYVQYNDGGALNGDATFTFNETTKVLSVAAVTTTGNVTVGGIIVAGVSVRTTPTTVALLPTAGTAGRRAFVTDANSAAFASVLAAGATTAVPVYDDGTNWRIG